MLGSRQVAGGLEKKKKRYTKSTLSVCTPSPYPNLWPGKMSLVCDYCLGLQNSTWQRNQSWPEGLNTFPIIPVSSKQETFCYLAPGSPLWISLSVMTGKYWKSLSGKLAADRPVHIIRNQGFRLTSQEITAAWTHVPERSWEQSKGATGPNNRSSQRRTRRYR